MRCLQKSGHSITIRLLIFDLDGTLADTKQDLVLSVNAMRASLGLPHLSDEIISSYVGRGAAVLVAKALGGDFSPDLDRVIRRAVAKLPEARHRSALDLAKELRAALWADPCEQLRSLAHGGIAMRVIPSSERTCRSPRGGVAARYREPTGATVRAE